MLKQKTHLPVIVDPSHASGIRFMVEPLALAAIAAGADGLMIEVHNDPEKALCDGAPVLNSPDVRHTDEKDPADRGFLPDPGLIPHKNSYDGADWRLS